MTSKPLDELIDNHVIVIYDGICGFCDATIQFILDREPSKKLRFVAFQSETGQQLLQRYGFKKELDAITLIENGRATQKSKAFLTILKYIKGPYRHAHHFKIIPSVIIDFFYDIIAAYRYRIMGKKEQCRLLTPTERQYFIE